MTDPITDMFNRIRNAQAVLHPTVDLPYSKLKYKIAKIFEEKRFITSIETKKRKDYKIIRIVLKYDKENKPVIAGLKKVSKPGQRIYEKCQKIKKAKKGYGIIIISTSKGLMTGEEAEKQKLGGEILGQIW